MMAKVQFDEEGYPIRDREESDPEIEKFTEEDIAFLLEFQEMTKEFNQ